ncbi:MAG: hypothetical protein OEQ15_05910 [Nitrosopumilus sp.]|nr:hypothetical protein [Nitrosopumilus sp.]MDH3794285.1 hypothetical protein [Nitrosopumilus sp.]MDH3854686.1 hypothetical protein [Nitrosopumilus sp.]
MISQIEHNFEISERERVVLERIKNNPDLHHNALLKQIVPEFMAKTTFEKTRDSLLEKEIIFVKTSGNMKFYVSTENYEEKLQYRIEHNTNNSYHDLKLKIKKLNTNYTHNDINGKIILANFLLVNLIRADNGFTILDSVKNPKKTLYRDEHLTIQQLIHQVFTIIRDDKDFGIVFPIIVSNMEFFMPRDSLDE